jgi:hypothetical protein
MGETNLGGYYTMVDIANEYADGDLLHIANTLARTHEILADAPYQEANQLFSHKGSQDATLPSPGFRAFNEGVANSTAKSRPVIDGLAIAEDYAEVDYEEYRIQPKKEEWRQRKDSKHIAGMGNTIANEIFYGSIAANPKGFNGVATRFALSTTRPNGDTSWPFNVQLNGGSGADTTSIWVIEWDPDECTLLYPRGSKAGIEFEDLGKVTKEVSSTKYEVLRSHFLWKCGIFISDDSRCQRIANIESAGSDNLFNEDLLIAAINNTPGGGMNKQATRIYVNRTIKTQMQIRLKDKSNVHFTRDQGLDGGGPVLSFDGIPIRLCDSILITETAIS